MNTEGKKQYTRDFLMQLQRDPQESAQSVSQSESLTYTPFLGSYS